MRARPIKSDLMDMGHGLNNDMLYSAVKIEAHLLCSYDGKSKVVIGTGFFVSDKSNNICLITNRHMVDPTYKKGDIGYSLVSLSVNHTVQGDDGNPSASQQDEIVSCSIGFDCVIENDVACLSNLKFFPDIKKKNKVDYFIPWSLFAKDEEIGSKLSVCDMVAFTGFPEWHDKNTVRPIFRAGTIASDPRFNYEYFDETGNKIVSGNCILYEAFSFAGSSGSPVFSYQKGIAGNGIVDSSYSPVRLIGINAGHLTVADSLTSAHSGLSYFYTSSRIVLLLDGKMTSENWSDKLLLTKFEKIVETFRVIANL